MVDEDSGRKSPVSQPSSRKSPEKSSSIEFADEDPAVEITSNLSFNIKKDDTKDTTSSGIQLKHEVVKEKKRSADYQDIVKDYEDVSNMLRRMRLKKRGTTSAATTCRTTESREESAQTAARGHRTGR